MQQLPLHRPPLLLLLLLSLLLLRRPLLRRVSVLSTSLGRLNPAALPPPLLAPVEISHASGVSSESSKRASQQKETTRREGSWGHSVLQG